MKTGLITSDTYQNHNTGDGHPEKIDRVLVILENFKKTNNKNLIWKKPSKVKNEILEITHSSEYIKFVQDSFPKKGLSFLDGDTIVSPGSKDATLDAVGSIIAGIDGVQKKEFKNAFCAVRPPGHHAEKNKAMGFCIYNNVAIGAHYLLEKYKLNKVAIIDFDVHHGNGTQKMFWNDPNMFYASTHQEGIFPGTGFKEETGINNNIVNVPLPAGTDSLLFKKSYENIIFPKLEKFSPEIIFVSAGFDAHISDPLADFKLIKDDFYWITKKLNNFATKHCKGKLISCLEGGYNIKALSESCLEHVKGLIL